MILYKSPRDIEIMKKGGNILSEVLKIILGSVDIGVRLSELDSLAEKEIIRRGGQPSFKKVPRYHWSICTCVNEVVVHGIPGEYRIAKNDVVGIDCGVFYQGFHTDAAWTIKIPASPAGRKNEKDDIDTFLACGERTLQKAIAAVKEGNYVYDISEAIQKTVEAAGYSVVRTLVGHGVGKNLHEEPEVPGIIKGERKESPKLSVGMTLALEVIYNMGGPDVVYKDDDGWTIVTKDGKISGLFEATVAVTSHGCLVLTPIKSWVD